MLYINGTDITRVYGIHLLEQGACDFVSIGRTKKPTEVAWYEQDGIETDLHALYMEPRQITVQCCHTSREGYDRFVAEYVRSPALHSVLHVRSGITRRVGVVGVSSYVRLTPDYPDSATFGLILEEPIPWIPTTEAYPLSALQPSQVRDQGVRLDEVSLSRYGVWMTSGAQTLHQDFVMKGGEQQVLKHASGALHHPRSKAAIDAKNVRLGLHTSGANAVSSYLTLMAQLLRPGLHSWEGYQCYFTESTVTNFSTEYDTWMDFGIALRIVGGSSL